MIQKIYSFMTRIGLVRGQDVILHATVGGITMALCLIFINDKEGALVGFLAATALGLGKEMYYKYIKKTFYDFFDMFFTMLGSVTVLFGYAIIEWLIGLL